MNKMERIVYLVKTLNEASKAYEQENREIMSNYEYDALYDELVELEFETGYIMAMSPTQRVGYDVVSELPKKRHPQPMLSLDKTKEVTELKKWLGDRKGHLSWKLDGLTIVLTYEDGTLVEGVTRGNGEIGEVVTNNVKTFLNVPLSIPFKHRIVLRGEAVMKYSTFNEINEEIEDIESRYKNPRNLCSGTVRQLNSAITKMRGVYWYAFDLIERGDGEGQISKSEDFQFLESIGFETVDYCIVNNSSELEGYINIFSSEIENEDNPSDGLVLAYDDLVYARSLGSTAKFPRNAIAFKWKDDTVDAEIIDVEWSVGRTGVITPVAVFNPVEIEGTTVQRASLHNVSILESLEIGYGDTVSVYKANKIIPQILRNYSCTSTVVPPAKCPVCGGDTILVQENDTKELMCNNPDCSCKKLKAFSHFVSRNAMNISGISEGILEKLLSYGIVREFSDIYDLENHYEEFVSIEGLGGVLFDKLVDSIKKSKYCDMANFLYALGIPNIGLQNARLICNEYNYQLEAMASADEYELSLIDGIGDVLGKCFSDYFMVDEHVCEIQRLLSYLYFYSPIENEEQYFVGTPLQFEYVKVEEREQVLDGLVFVCTGSLHRFRSRDVMKDLIVSLGGKLTGSVSRSTSYLITNDTSTGTEKNKKAEEYGIPIITEDEFIKNFELEKYI